VGENAAWVRRRGQLAGRGHRWQRGEQGVRAGIAGPQARDAGAGPGDDRSADMADHGLAVGGVVAFCLPCGEVGR